MQRMNFHTHSIYCDGTGTPEDYVQSALRKEFHALGFSGHTPLPFQNDWTMDEDTLPVYLNEIRRLRELYRGRIEIYLGLETDYLDDEHNANSPLLKSLGLDYQISSVHMLCDPADGIYYSVDGPPDELEHLIKLTFKGSARDLVRAYYRQLQRMIETGGFDIIGHFDLIKKHNNKLNFFSEEESWYRKIVEETLHKTSATGTMLEINTGAMSRGYADDPYPSPWIIELCAREKIPVILGSDAHKPEFIDYAFRETEELLISKGYRYGWGLLKNTWQEVRYGKAT